MKIGPVKGEVVVRKIAEHVSLGSRKIEIAGGTAVQWVREGIVVAVGELIDLRVGDRIIFSEEHAKSLQENGSVYLVVQDSDILKNYRRLEDQSLNAAELLPEEKADLLEEVQDLVDDPKVWLDTPHPSLGWQKPKDLIGTANEQFLRDLLRSIRYVGMT
jgi:co-chaperonin GroES (HSP10)